MRKWAGNLRDLAAAVNNLSLRKHRRLITCDRIVSHRDTIYCPSSLRRQGIIADGSVRMEVIREGYAPCALSNKNHKIGFRLAKMAAPLPTLNFKLFFLPSLLFFH